MCIKNLKFTHSVHVTVCFVRSVVVSVCSSVSLCWNAGWFVSVLKAWRCSELKTANHGVNIGVCPAACPHQRWCIIYSSVKNSSGDPCYAENKTHTVQLELGVSPCWCRSPIGHLFLYCSCTSITHSSSTFFQSSSCAWLLFVHELLGKTQLRDMNIDKDTFP